jgi:acetylornithine deacetylase
MNIETHFQDAKELLGDLIACPSMSREEDGTATIIEEFLKSKSIPSRRLHHNVWATNLLFDPSKPSILLNSHHDTVKANPSWTVDPFCGTEIDGKLIGLGSNDAGASLVCLILTFCHFYDNQLPFNLVLAATAEEEISGSHGIESLLNSLDFPEISWAIIGEPTDCQLAIAEKGLMVIDAVSTGKSGHAAREEGINAIDLAIEDILKINTYEFPKISDLLGQVKTTVTVIHAGKQHNVIPEICEYTIDCRVNECYTLDEVLKTLQELVKAELKPRSMRLKPSKIEAQHPIVQLAEKLGIKTYGSPTLSDQALLNFPSVKIGPGHSGRSHTANEYILLDELKQGIQTYQTLIEHLNS